MNRLTEHIKFLLLNSEYVVVPGLGGFIVSDEEAEINTVSGRILAPRTVLSFNQALTHNDGLLIQLYAQSQSVSFSEAESLIQSDVTLLKANLASFKQVRLGNWGMFELSEEKNIVFTPNFEFSFLRPSLFGLQDIQIRELSQLQTEQNYVSERSSRALLWKIVKYSATSAAAALLIFAISVPIADKNRNSEQYASFFPEKIGLANKSMNIPSQKSAISENSIWMDVKPKPTQDTLSSEEKNSYFIIVGTFKTGAVAQKELWNFKQKGFDSAGIIESSVVKRVYVAGFETEEDAYTYLKKFAQENKKNSDAWVYHQKNS